MEQTRIDIIKNKLLLLRILLKRREDMLDFEIETFGNIISHETDKKYSEYLEEYLILEKELYELIKTD